MHFTPMEQQTLVCARLNTFYRALKCATPARGVADFSLRPFECILSRTKVRYSSAWVSSA